MSELDALREATMRLREAESAVEAAQEARDDALMAATQAGAKVLDIQLATGLSAARVGQIRAARRR